MNFPGRSAEYRKSEYGICGKLLPLLYRNVVFLGVLEGGSRNEEKISEWCKFEALNLGLSLVET